LLEFKIDSAATKIANILMALTHIFNSNTKFIIGKDLLLTNPLKCIHQPLSAHYFAVFIHTMKFFLEMLDLMTLIILLCAILN
jgi:hypothetical protein